MRNRRHRRAGGEVEPPAGLKFETGLRDRRLGVSAEVTATRDPRPEGCVGESLQAPTCRRVGNDVLVEVESPARADNSAQLGQGALLVGDRAEHEGGDPRIEGLIRGGQRSRDSVDHLDRDRRLGCGLARRFAQHALRLDRENPFHRLGVEREVEPVASADLDHLAFQSGQELAAVAVLLA